MFRNSDQYRKYRKTHMGRDRALSSSLALYLLGRKKSSIITLNKKRDPLDGILGIPDSRNRAQRSLRVLQSCYWHFRRRPNEHLIIYGH